MAAKRKHRENILKLQSAAAEYFQRLLFKDRSPQAQMARDYLTSRQITKEIAVEWKLGYAPENQRMFFDWAAQNKFPTELLVDGGLAAWRDENYRGRGTWARFRHRLMFPT